MLNEKLIENGEKPGNNYDRQTTFADGIARKSTFSRAFTFDGAYIRDGLAQPIDAISRTLTEVGHRFDPDAKFTKSVIADYTKVSSEGNEGDIPFPEGFCNTYPFIQIIFWVGIVACIMGIMAAGFMNFTDEVRWPPHQPFLALLARSRAREVYSLSAFTFPF